MTLCEIENFLTDLGFHKTKDEVKKIFNDPFKPNGLERRLITYERPDRTQKVKITIIDNGMVLQSDCGKKQRTAWKSLVTVEEFRTHFML